MTENKFGRKIQNLRTGIGCEYISNEKAIYLTKKGIRHEPTVPYCPENGVAERKNRSLTEIVRCMLTEAGLQYKSGVKQYVPQCISKIGYQQNQIIKLRMNCGQIGYETYRTSEFSDAKHMLRIIDKNAAENWITRLLMKLR